MSCNIRERGPHIVGLDPRTDHRNLHMLSNKTKKNIVCILSCTLVNEFSFFFIGYGYLMLDKEYSIPCCGVISSWEFFGGRDVSGTVELQVWRADGPGYKLVGENTWNFTLGMYPCNFFLNMVNIFHYS